MLSTVRSTSASRVSAPDLQVSRSAMSASRRFETSPHVSNAHSGHSQTVQRTGQIDPQRPFKFASMDGRYTSECGRSRNATVATAGGGGSLLVQKLRSLARSDKKLRANTALIPYYLLCQWAAAVCVSRIGVVAGHGREQLLVVPVAFAFRRLLDLEQIEVRHHAAISLHVPVRREGVVDRQLLE